MRSHRLPVLLAGVLMAVALAAAVPVLLARHHAEQGSRQVELVAEFSSFRQLALEEGYPVEQLFRDLKAAGVTAVAVAEQNVQNLVAGGEAAVLSGAEVHGLLAQGAQVHPLLVRLAGEGRIHAAHTYILPATAAVGRRVYDALAGGLGTDRVVWHRPGAGSHDPGTVGVIEVAAPPLFLEQVGLGFSAEEMALVRAAGLRPVLRPRNRPYYTAAAVAELFAEMERLAPEANTVIAFGNQIPGFRADDPEPLRAFVREMAGRRWILAGIEHYTQLGYVNQEGLDAAVQGLDYRVARVYALSQKELDKFRPEVSVDKWVRSVLERNIRILYLRPFLQWQDPGETRIETNLKYLRATAEQLRGYGFQLGGPGTFAPVTIPWWQRGLIGLGAVGAGLLWLAFTWPVPPGWLAALALLGAAGSFAAVRVMPNTGPEVLALATAVLFPTLGGTLLLCRWGAAPGAAPPAGGGAAPAAGPSRSAWREGAAAFLTVGLTALAGAVLVASLLGDIRYLLEFRYFRGVKVALAAPLGLLAVSYLFMGRSGRPGEVVRAVARDIRAVLQTPLRYKHVAVGLLALAGVFWYIQRSGNFPVVPVPEWERQLRFWLEQTLVARPRFKEFAIGYPALALAALAAARGWRGAVLPFLLVGATAGISVVNSFSHLRTPVAMSLLRTAHGFWLGAITGVAAAILADQALRWIATLSQRGPGR